jgi:NAD(P)-dependent dehydrogenase (short-subunit alcohol dehydrogenase family)
MNRLAGKTAIITGAGSGIGRASARLFASEGANVVAIDLNEEGLVETAEGAEAQIDIHAADISNEKAVEAFVNQTLEKYGDVDVFFANAGISGGWQNVLNVNLIGPFLAVKYAGHHMAKQGKGSIICTASVAGLRANAGGSPYSASKAGVISLVQTVANELYGTGVRVNAICPGLTETGMTKPIFDGARARGNEDKIGQLNPMTRYGTPDEIANMALFLASDDASYVNGQAIAVDGGLSSTHPFVRRR